MGLVGLAAGLGGIYMDGGYFFCLALDTTGAQVVFRGLIYLYVRFK